MKCEHCFMDHASTKPIEFTDRGEAFRAWLCADCAADPMALHSLACEVREADD